MSVRPETPHYTNGEIECIDAIASALGPAGYSDYLRGQIIKYAWRLPHKDDRLSNAKKLLDYAQWLLENEQKLKTVESVGV